MRNKKTSFKNNQATILFATITITMILFTTITTIITISAPISFATRTTISTTIPFATITITMIFTTILLLLL